MMAMETQRPTKDPAPEAAGLTQISVIAGCAGCLAWPLLLIGLMCTQTAFADGYVRPLLAGLAAGLAGVPLLVFAWRKGRRVDRLLAAVAAPLALFVIGDCVIRLL
jgi:hypothetical protein